MKTLVTKLIALLLLSVSANAFAQGGGITINANQTTDLTKPQNPNNPTKPEIPPEIRTQPEEEVKKVNVVKNVKLLCGHKTREIDHYEVGPWTSKKVVRDMSLSSPTRTAVFVDVTWTREVKSIFKTMICELPLAHPGAHRGKAGTETDVKIVTETIRYGAGDPHDPPKDHWTDKLPLK